MTFWNHLKPIFDKFCSFGNAWLPGTTCNNFWLNIKGLRAPRQDLSSTTSTRECLPRRAVVGIHDFGFLQARCFRVAWVPVPCTGPNRSRKSASVPFAKAKAAATSDNAAKAPWGDWGVHGWGRWLYLYTEFLFSGCMTKSFDVQVLTAGCRADVLSKTPFLKLIFQTETAKQIKADLEKKYTGLCQNCTS